MVLNLVTGGAGFVGRHLVGHLLARGEDVRILDFKVSPAMPPGVDVRLGSVTEHQAVEEAMKGVDCVFHLAALTSLWAKPSASFDAVNAGGTHTVLACARHSGVKAAVHVSSVVTLIGRDTALRGAVLDEHSTAPIDAMLGPYPRSKRLAEDLVLEAAAEGLRVALALPAVPVGPGDYSMTPPSRMLQQLLSGALPATLDCILNLIDVRALARALIAVREKGEPGERYVLAGEDVPMRKFLATLRELTGRPMPERTVPFALAYLAGVASEAVAGMTGHPPSAPLTGIKLAHRQVKLSSERMRRELGLEPTPVKAALQEAIEWMVTTGRVAPLQVAPLRQ